MQIAFRVHGDVQGVGYRRFVVHVAHELGLAGWVRNELEGTVCGEAEGPEASMTVFRARLAQGPPFALITRLDWEDPDMRSSLPLPFEIRR